MALRRLISGTVWLSVVLACAAVAAGTADEDLAGAPAAGSHWPRLLGEQYTFVLQNQSTLHSPYAGPLSLDPKGDTQPTHTIGFYLGWALTVLAQLYVATEKFMGAGVSSATGLGGLTNGDVVREGASTL